MKLSIISQRLKIAREKHGYTQKTMAEKLSVAKQTYNGYERGVANPDIQTLANISKLLNVTIDYLIGSDQETIIILKDEYEILMNAKKVLEKIKIRQEIKEDSITQYNDVHDININNGKLVIGIDKKDN